MANDTSINAASITAAVSPTVGSRVKQHIALAGVLLLATFFRFFQLSQEGFSNTYYAAAVKSMLSSWHNFFYISFDPGGFVSVDKPPLGLWIQAASARLFGFDGWALLLPQALAGVICVLVLYHLVKRAFGPNAGLLAALILALTPITVAANRNSTMDSLLVLTLLLSAWAISLAAERGTLAWLLSAFFLVGLGFNIKMLQAFLVLPAFILVYLVAAPISRLRRIVHLAIATLLLLIVSLAWPLAVDLTPPEERPYVGSSQNNSVMELIIGHNGLSRLLPGGIRSLVSDGSDQPEAPPRSSIAPVPGDRPALQPGSPQRAPQMPGPGGGPGDETGDPGMFRLFNRQLAGQISWLLPLAVLGSLIAAWKIQRRRPLDRKHQSLLLWLAWLLPMIAFFSFANLFHRYYLEMLAPAIAALTAAALAALWRAYRGSSRPGWLLPPFIMGGVIYQALILAEFPEWSRWLVPLIVGLALVAAITLFILRVIRNRGTPLVQSAMASWAQMVMAIGVVSLLIAPAVWAYTPILFGGNSGLPFAGPDLQVGSRVPGDRQMTVDDPLIAYLQDEYNGESFLVATPNARTAAPIILTTGHPVMAMGGFSGGDPILTIESLEELVIAGEVRFFLISSSDGRQSDLTRWIEGHCHPSSASADAQAGARVPQQLYDCARPVT